MIRLEFKQLVRHGIVRKTGIDLITHLRIIPECLSTVNVPGLT